MRRTRVRLPSSPLSVIPPKEGLPTQTPIRTGSDLDAFAPLTRQPEGERTSPDPANLILSYQEIAVPKL